MRERIGWAKEEEKKGAGGARTADGVGTGESRRGRKGPIGK